MSLKVLVIDRAPPVDRQQGNALIGAEVFRRLAHHDLTLLAPATDPERERADAELAGVFRRTCLVARGGRVPALAGSLEPALARIPSLPGLDLDAARRLRRRLAELVREGGFDLVHVRQLPMAAYGRRAPGRRILELVDSETLGAERALPRSARVRVRAALAGRVERRAMRGYDVVTAVADADAQRLRELDATRRVDVVPNGVDIDRFRPMPELRPDPARLAFVGAMSFSPNVLAMTWFCRDVLPAIRAQVPDATLEIVGRDPTEAVIALGELPGVTVVGEVADVVPHLARAAVVVAPILSGSGIKNKVLEAFAAGRPVVATHLAVEGLPVTDGLEASVVGTGPAMVEATVDLLRSPNRAAAMGARARRLVEERYSWDACAGTYDRLYHELAGRTAR